MCRVVVACSLLMLSVVPLGYADEPNESQPAGDGSKEIAKLQGTWKLAHLVRNGKTATPTEIEDTRLIISESEYTYKGPDGKRQQGTIKLDPSRKPAVMQTTRTKLPEAAKTINRIYMWTEKGTMKICTPGPDERTPDNFEAPEGSGRELAVWKKIDK